jgi:hypothetical protein
MANFGDGSAASGTAMHFIRALWSEQGVVLGWPKQCKFAHAFLREYSDKGLKLAQLLGQRGVLLTLAASTPFKLSSRARQRVGGIPASARPSRGRVCHLTENGSNGSKITV